MPRYKLTVAYDGTNFHGWQKQCASDGPAQESLRTVQGVLEKAIVDVVRERVSVQGASRTDAGVHAVGQVAAFSCQMELAPDRLAPAINSRLPDDAQVRSASIIHEGFSPITDAVSKGYRYRIAHGRKGPPPAGLPPLFSRHTTFWTPYRLDPIPMNEAARRLVGEHDFTSFTRKNHGRESPVRTIFDCTVTATGRHRCRLDICGDGFLHNMVRIIAGTLVEVGRGRIDPGALGDILAAADRTAAGPTLPPQGLCLMWVRYENVAEGARPA